MTPMQSKAHYMCSGHYPYQAIKSTSGCFPTTCNHADQLISDHRSIPKYIEENYCEAIT